LKLVLEAKVENAALRRNCKLPELPSEDESDKGAEGRIKKM